MNLRLASEVFRAVNSTTNGSKQRIFGNQRNIFTINNIFAHDILFPHCGFFQLTTIMKKYILLVDRKDADNMQELVDCPLCTIIKDNTLSNNNI